MGRTVNLSISRLTANLNVESEVAAAVESFNLLIDTPVVLGTISRISKILTLTRACHFGREKMS